MTTLQPAPRPTAGIDGVVDPVPRRTDGVVERVVELLRRRPEPRPAARAEPSEHPALATVTDLRASHVRARRVYDCLRAARLDDDHALASAWDELTTIERESRRAAASSG
jgi:hypothetical protein